MKFLKGLLITLCLAIFVLILILIDKFGSVTMPESSKEPSVEVSAQQKPVEETESTMPTVISPSDEEKPTNPLTEQEAAENTREIIKRLAVSAGNEETMKAALSLQTQLKNSGHTEYYNLLTEILNFANGTGNGEKLLSYNAAADKETVRQAAVSCWAAGQNKENTAVFSFTGDCTFAYFNEMERKGGFVTLYENSGSVTYPFDNVRGVFSSDDITAVNFEGVLTDSANHAEKQFYFRGKKEYAKILSEASVESANLANNHTLDYFEKGFEDTVKALESEKIGLFWDSEPYVRSLRTESGTISVVMLSASSIDIKNLSKFDVLKKQIERYESPGTIVIVNLHWGTERAVKPSDWQIETAHELVDAGADLIVGHHPHVLQGIEKYKGVYIAYSLGNFAFGGNSMASLPETMILRAVFETDSGEIEGCSISAVPCYITSSGSVINDYKPSLRYGENGQNVIDLILSRSALLENGITDLDWHKINS